jgi:hypothetical protein
MRGPRPKSGKPRLKLHGTFLVEGKSIGSDPTKTKSIKESS